MAAPAETPLPEEALVPPYIWKNDVLPSRKEMQLWQDVADQLEKQQTVVWTSAVQSLNLVNIYLRASRDAREFMERYMLQIIGILVEQQPTKIGPHERKCVQESLGEAVAAVSKDLMIQIERGPAAVCKTLEVLSSIFNKKKMYYKGHKTQWNVNHYSGLPEVRMKMIERFQQEEGFDRLYQYMMQRLDQSVPIVDANGSIPDGPSNIILEESSSPTMSVPPNGETSNMPSLNAQKQGHKDAFVGSGFPHIEQLYHILNALADNIPNSRNGAKNKNELKQQTPPSAQTEAMEKSAVDISNATMKYIDSCSEDSLKKIRTDQLTQVLCALQRIFDRLSVTRRESTNEFYAFWRSFCWKLITSRSLPLKLFGWQQVDEILMASGFHRPPPRSYIAERAGCSFVNGEYVYAGATTPAGYALAGSDVTFERKIPVEIEDGGGKTLTLFRCTMRSQQKWWFLSEADEEQPGTDRDIDYYQHKSKEHEETEPPRDGWITCRGAGIDPPPILVKHGRMVPPGEEFNTLEHQLAKWAIANDIVELVLGDSVHREIVARSTPLIRFLASMCERDTGVESSRGQPNAYCLTIEHLLLAWKTCTRKTDEAVSAQIYQLLVSILPSCPNCLAIPLMKEIRKSLIHVSNDKQDYLPEVADFCTALAVANPSDNVKANVVALSNPVRAEVLELLWQVLMHPEASCLKSYDVLKRYVTHELGVEPEGTKHREKYLQSCLHVLTENSRLHAGGTVDETQALKMAKLTHFVLQACTREQAAKLVRNDNDAIPSLLLDELTSFMKRRQSGIQIHTPLRKSPSIESETKDGSNALSQRLKILRYVFGMDDNIYMSAPQLKHLWQMCSAPSDREELMVFIASASGTSNLRNFPALNPAPNTQLHQQVGPLPQGAPIVGSDDGLSAAFSESVSAVAFLSLFCDPGLSFELLGERAYQSFQLMSKKTRESTTHGQEATSAALDALWRIALVSRNEMVASQAMKDLLDIYNKPASSLTSSSLELNETSFGKRVFECLSKVKESLSKGDLTAELAAGRCLRILNAAIGQGESTICITSSTLVRLAHLSPDKGMEDVVKLLPHGMRGQACYVKVNVMVKKSPIQGQGPNSNPDRDQGYHNQSRNGSTYRFTLDVHPLETLSSIKAKVGAMCQCPNSSVKAISATGRVLNHGTRSATGDGGLSAVPENSVVDELGIVQGCELVFFIADRQNAHQSVNQKSAKTLRIGNASTLSELFCDDKDGFVDKLYNTLMDVLELLPWRETDDMIDSSKSPSDSHKLVWDLLLAMPTNSSVANQVLSSSNIDRGPKPHHGEDAMDIDSRQGLKWSNLLDLKNFHRSVYVLLAIDAFLQPAVEVLSSLPAEHRSRLEQETHHNSTLFRETFIDSGGFDAVVDFFSFSENRPQMSQSMTRMGNAVALRILKCCVFGDRQFARHVGVSAGDLDETGTKLLRSLVRARGLLRSLTSMVVADTGVSSSTISDILKLLHRLLKSEETAKMFVSQPENMAERFLNILLLWEGGSDSSRSVISSATNVRKNARDLVLSTTVLSSRALSWLKNAIDTVDVTADSTQEFFELLERLISTESSDGSLPVLTDETTAIATAVCKKLASCPRPSSETLVVDFSTGVLCGCLSLLRALIENSDAIVLSEGISVLLKEFQTTPWSKSIKFDADLTAADVCLIDLMGIIFDSFLSPGGATSVLAICCDKPSRQKGFEVVVSAARHCNSGIGYMGIVHRINTLVSSAAPYLKHRWGLTTGGAEGSSRHGRNTSKYSGLRNQGCTCYMNSFLQQMFMMPELRRSLCSASLPASVRASGGIVSARGSELVGRRVSFQWENGSYYDAVVEAFDVSTGMHTIRYEHILVATVSGSNHHQISQDEVACLPPALPDEFFLSEGRPGKETGVFELVAFDGSTDNGDSDKEHSAKDVEEDEDEANSRHLMEEVQRTFIHLEEGSRGRCFDPRALVEACACLKLEFDVWQQNDASEFATKLLDRLEVSLKKWAPEHFHYMHHTFGLKQTKQKICKECGMKTNREEKHMNIDCQIRGKSDIHEALAAMCETEIMEGNNQVFCDNCKKNTDTVLRNSISELPNMMILSLKRFDLDYTTFETVKLNSKCAFGQTLNMKRYTLEGVEAMEQAEQQSDDTDTMDIGTEENALKRLPDEDYEFKLVGVLVHAGVAQGGHYYSFIKDRSDEKWYRFDDEDVTPFDPGSIEVECFGGKVKKETKWPNGQVHTVESEQYANALMLFYEKVKPKQQRPLASEAEQMNSPDRPNIKMTNGYDVFEPDVQRSNATHRWQSFLFDAEFQSFLAGLLGLCRMSCSNAMDVSTSSSPLLIPAPWRNKLVDMLLTFLFDVLLYSNEKPSLGDWVLHIEQIMMEDRNCASEFALKLGIKASEISCNWLRTFLLECPDAVGRLAGVRIFSKAILSSLSLPEEQKKLERWTNAWTDQITRIEATGDIVAMPPGLLGDAKESESVTTDPSYASAAGAVVSFLNVLVDAIPRSWRFSPELFLFIRNLSSVDSSSSGRLLRDGILKCLLPARMISIIARQGGHAALRAAFPASSVRHEVAESQMRPEHSAQAHLVMPMNGNQVLTHADTNYRADPSPFDYMYLLEALGCLMGIPGIVQAPLIAEQDDQGRGRQRIVLSEPATQALREVFRENCAESAPGMGQREIESYLRRSGVDNVSSQKIMDMMSKYPTTNNGGGGKGVNFLSLDGFLAYYRDYSQSNEMKVRHDMHTLGFRPDLSRRPRNARLFTSEDGEEKPYSGCESAALDVFDLFNENPPSLGKWGDTGLSAIRLHEMACAANEQLGEYLLSSALIRKSMDYSSPMIHIALRTMYQATIGWTGADILSSTIRILKILASIPDQYQKDRIHDIMLCNHGEQSDGTRPCGLITAAHNFYHGKTQQAYSQQDIVFAFERFCGYLKELLKLQCICRWMNDNRNFWAFMERDLLDSHRQRGRGHVQSRNNDYREPDDGGIPLDHHHHSDSDGMLGIHDSEEDEDEDSRLEDAEMYQESPQKIVITGAGNDAVNGIFVREGTFDKAYKYSKVGNYQGEKVMFSIFRCNVSNNTKHWYISIVPKNSRPGTSSDIDFYSAPVTSPIQELPPLSGWVKAMEGKDPTPTLQLDETAIEDPNPIHRGGYNDWSEDQGGNSIVQNYV